MTADPDDHDKTNFIVGGFDMHTGIGMKYFEIPIARGLCLALKEGDVMLGAIEYTFESDSQGPYKPNAGPGKLLARAKVAIPGRETLIAEFEDTSCFVRQAADKSFRQWVRNENLRNIVREAIVEILDEANTAVVKLDASKNASK